MLFRSVLRDIRIVELIIFAGALVILRKFKVSAIAIIFGSGVVGTVVYTLMGAVG